MDADGSSGHAESPSTSDGAGLDAATTSVGTVELVGLALAAVILAWGLFAPAPGSMTPAVQRVLAVFFFALVLWLTKALPYVVSSVLSVTLLYALGLVDTFGAAVEGFASSLVFFLFLLLLLGSTISDVGLDQRVASRLLSATSTPSGSIRSLATNLLLLSFLMPSALARAVTFFPVVRRIGRAYGLDRGSDFERSSFLILGHVNPVASMALMTGGGMPIITSEIVNESVRGVTWVEWAVFMIPPVLVLYWFGALTARRIYAVDDATTVDDAADGGDFAQSVLGDDDGPLSRDERIVGWVMVGTVLLWIVGSFVGLPTIVPAALAVAALALPGVEIITADDIAEVSWGILFLIGAMFSILGVMEATGTLSFLVEAITASVPFGAFNGWQTVLALLLLAAVIRVFFSTASAAIVVVLPIVLEFAGVLGVNPLYLALSVLLVIGSTTFLPFNTTSVLLAFDRGPLTTREVFGFGAVTMVYSLVVVALAWLFYWPLVT